MSLADHKKEIWAAIFGALISAVLSFGAGLYNLNESFKLTQKKELIYSLKTDITLLRKVDSELDENLNLLLNDNYQVEIETSPVEFKGLSGMSKKDKENMEALLEIVQKLPGKIFKVTKLQMPKEQFVADAWQSSGPAVSEINFDLIQNLDDFYRNLRHINKFIEGAHTLSVGMTVVQSDINEFNQNIPRYNKLISEISRKTILQLKNRVADELSKLQKERASIRI